MSQKAPRLLVATPTLGQSAWLAETVASVTALAGPQARQVLAAPPTAARSLGPLFPSVTVIADGGRRGVYPAINDAWRTQLDQDWDWFTWINDDDLLLPGFTQALALACAHDGRAANAPWFYGGVRLQSGEGRPLGRLAVCRRPADIIPLVDSGISPLNQQGMLIPRYWLETLGGLREDIGICADFDLWLRALLAGARFIHVPAELALFRLREGQISGDVARHEQEFQKVRADNPHRIAGPLSRRLAKLRFRLDNLGVYWERRRLTGLRSGYALLSKPEGKGDAKP